MTNVEFPNPLFTPTSSGPSFDQWAARRIASLEVALAAANARVHTLERQLGIKRACSCGGSETCAIPDDCQRP